MLFVWALVIALIGAALFFGWRSRDKKPENFVPSGSAEALPPVAATQISTTPQKRSFAKAIGSWIPLLKEKSKDKNRWEEVLILSDMGPRLSAELIEGLEKSEADPLTFLKQNLLSRIEKAEAPGEPWLERKPWVLFIVGVNGVGKTTTIVKLAHYFKKQGRSVGVIGADTFRKAAVEQLQRGCALIGTEVFSLQGADGSEGADPAAVVFDGLRKFAQTDVVIVDTSGRLTTKKNLMEELKKMKRVADKSLPGAPHDTWLVMDSTLGQSAVDQGLNFHEAVGLTGLVLTKLDGLSRGGTVFQLFQRLNTPIRFLGYGETPEDLEPFRASIFIEELFDVEKVST